MRSVYFRSWALFCRANPTERCPVSGVKQPYRRNPETAEVDPTRTSATLAHAPHLGFDLEGIIERRMAACFAVVAATGAPLFLRAGL
jgi:hypothetical protein